MDGLAAKGVLKGHDIVHLERHHEVGTGSFEQNRNVTRGDGIARLRLPVLARIGKIRDDRGDALGAVLLQGADEE